LEDGQGVAYGRARALKMSTCLSCLARVQVANSWFVGNPSLIGKVRVARYPPGGAVAMAPSPMVVLT
jgi:hypothetical protein